MISSQLHSSWPTWRHDRATWTRPAATALSCENAWRLSYGTLPTRASFSNLPRAGIAATIDRPPLELPGTQIGPYKLLEQIGEGGMGVVYVAEQREPIRRTVALKIIKPGMDTREVVARFEAERQALALMDHPNIAKVFDGGCDRRGSTVLRDGAGQGDARSPSTAIASNSRRASGWSCSSRVCQGVQHAHQKGIIHRDLKPSNVLVEVHDVRPVPKIIDFGIAKAMGQQLTDTIAPHGLRSDDGDAAVYEPRAGWSERPGCRYAQRHLFAGRAALRTAHGPHAVRKGHAAHGRLWTRCGGSFAKSIHRVPVRGSARSQAADLSTDFASTVRSSPASSASNCAATWTGS